jgi:hypothetical protein
VGGRREDAGGADGGLCQCDEVRTFDEDFACLIGGGGVGVGGGGMGFGL